MNQRKMETEIDQNIEVDEGESRAGIEKMMETLEEIFAPDGILQSVFPAYRPRSEQIQLSKEILRSLYEGSHLFAEAGTGTGKSFAYLMAATLFALDTGKVVLISTNTLPLQNQLMDKDLPIVSQVMKAIGYESFTYELAKGRRNYICRRRFELFISSVLSDERHPYREKVKEMVLFLDRAKTGLREEFPFYIPKEIWDEVAGEYDDCFHQYSPFYEKCFIQNARRSWNKAHLLVANHALVFSDLALKGGGEGGVLPKYDRLIFDEGHRVEETFSRFFERSLSLSYVDHLFRTIRLRRQGWMRNVFDGEVMKELEELFHPLREKVVSAFSQLADHLSEKAKKMGISPLEPVMEMIDTPLPVTVDLTPWIDRIISYLKGLEEERCGEEVEKRGMALLIERFREIGENFRFIIEGRGGEGWAHWLEKTPPRDAGLVDVQAEWIKATAQPIDAKLVLKELYDRVPLILVSATMATGGNFHFIADRLGITNYHGFIAGSPFDYSKNALLVISELAPDPRRESEYLTFLTNSIERVIKITGGRTLVLFTSFSLLEKAGEVLKEREEDLGVEILLHLPGEDRNRLIEAFRMKPNRVLFGCDSFWEGIDLPGDELKCLIITKLPFASPEDPLVKAKMNLIERKGRDPFMNWMVPSAILKMKQGVGRLIRTMDDRGAIIILDSRILTKRYGAYFLSHLPPAKRGKIGELSRYVN